MYHQTKWFARLIQPVTDTVIRNYHRRALTSTSSNRLPALSMRWTRPGLTNQHHRLTVQMLFSLSGSHFPQPGSNVRKQKTGAAFCFLCVWNEIFTHRSLSCSPLTLRSVSKAVLLCFYNAPTGLMCGKAIKNGGPLSSSSQTSIH